MPLTYRVEGERWTSHRFSFGDLPQAFACFLPSRRVVSLFVITVVARISGSVLVDEGSTAIDAGFYLKTTASGLNRAAAILRVLPHIYVTPSPNPGELRRPRPGACMGKRQPDTRSPAIAVNFSYGTLLVLVQRPTEPYRTPLLRSANILPNICLPLAEDVGGTTCST